MRTGSGPASTTTAEPGPARSTSPSPWPTSHIAMTHPSGGQPGVGGRASITTTSSPVQASAEDGRPSSRGASGTDSRHSTVRAASGSGPVPQSTAAVGTDAPQRATAMIHPAAHAAGAATTTPSGTHSSPPRPPARPSTVAGATAGAARRLAATATRLTCPDSAATTGVQATCAASGTDTASATQRGVHRMRASRHSGARSRMPAVASADSANPAVTASWGRKSRRPSTATPSPRTPRERPLRPIPTSATAPIAAARTTLGSARAVSTNPAMPSAPRA
jgi:hypothetical protein